MKQLDTNTIAEYYAKNTGKYLVLITSQFDFDNANSPTSWENFISKLPEKSLVEITSAILNNEYLEFDTQEEAMKLYSIMTTSIYYSVVYAMIIGPYGIIDENT